MPETATDHPRPTSRRKVVVAVVIAVLVVLMALGLVQYLRSMGGDTQENPGASNRVGPAEAGALETGGALDSDGGFRRLPARDMPPTVQQYPPTGPETDNPPPARDQAGSQARNQARNQGGEGDHDVNDNRGPGTQPR